jgi:hypothetical protein
MSFANLQVSVESLPRFSAVELRRLDPRYARVALGVALCFELPVLVVVVVLLFGVIVPRADLPLSAALLICGAVIAGMALLAWFVHEAASVMRYAVRERDVIVRSGVFWKKETVQPIRRIQHVEQHQGPVDKRFGLYELKLFSAGTGHFTFRIPGLDAAAASRIKQFILDFQEADWDDDPGNDLPEADGSEGDGREGDGSEGGREGDGREGDGSEGGREGDGREADGSEGNGREAESARGRPERSDGALDTAAADARSG